MPNLSTCLWFDHEAEEAVKFYTSIFKDSKVLGAAYYTRSAEGVSGKNSGDVMTIQFEMNGKEFIALNGGPDFKFNEAVSMVVNCDTQEEIDEYWTKLTNGGEIIECGWLKDRFGVSWQVIPKALTQMTQDQDVEKVDRVLHAMLQMKKIDLAKLKEAYEGKVRRPVRSHPESSASL